MSLFRTAEGWGYGLAAVGQGQEAVGAFPGAPLAPFKVGDQEAFALESYTSNSSVLSSMGNLTLAAAEVDGARVVGGTYLFTDWDPSHNPLFVVGGQRAPGRVAVRVNGDGSVVWSYSPAWSGGGPTVPVTLVAALVALAAAPVALLAAALARGRGARQTL
jgi:hypothetical protein